MDPSIGHPPLHPRVPVQAHGAGGAALVRVERGERAQPRRVVARAQVEQAVGVRQLAGEAERRLRRAGAAQRLTVRVVRARLQHGVRAAGHAAHAAQPVRERPLPAAGGVEPIKPTG
jgi:hypothetical protein